MTIDATPSWDDVITTKIRRFVLEMHSAMPGVVNSYDAATQTAEVKPLIKWQRFIPGRALRDLFDLPPLPDVLVCHPRGGSYGMHLPLAQGDLVLLVMCSRELTQWRGGSATSPAEPGTIDPMPLAGAIAIPLMTHDSQAWTGDIASNDQINIGKQGGAFDFVALATATKDEISALRDTVDSIVTAFNSHVHVSAAPGGNTSPPGSPASAPAAVGEIKSADVKVS